MRFSSSAYTILFDSDKNIAPKQVDIVVDSESFSYDNERIGTEFIIGVSHIARGAPVIRTGLCKDPPLVQALSYTSASATGYFMVFLFTIHPDGKGSYKPPTLRQLKFKHNSDDAADTSAAVDEINRILQVPLNDKRFLFLLNPAGGQGSSFRIYNEIVSPMLILAGLEDKVELVTTEYQKHATEIVSALDCSKYAALVSISGDGVFHEMVNGLLCIA
jgi:hypothetical protein